MSVTYVIDEAAMIVCLTANGPTSRRDIADAQTRLRADPAFRPTYHQLFDFRTATPTDIFGKDVDALLQSAPFDAGVRRAYVVSDGVVYGMGRMSTAFAEKRQLTLRLFDDVVAAKRWLATGE